MSLRGHTFVTDRLGPDSTVVDFGANKGDFARGIIEQFGCRVFSVEASPDVHATIPVLPKLKTFCYAMTDKNEPVTFHVSENSERSSFSQVNAVASHPVTVQGRSFDTFVTENGITSIDLLKMDIEGAEMPLLMTASDQSLGMVSQITIEMHDFTGAMTVADVRTLVERLERLGFRGIRFSNSNMDWLFVRPERLGIGGLSLAWMKYVRRNWRFLMRNLTGRRSE